MNAVRQHIQFSDRLVSYDTFLNDLAARVADKIRLQSSEPEYISQRRAYAIFGRGNVDRWRRQGRVQPFRRPGKVEYRMAQLRKLQQTVQDYL